MNRTGARRPTVALVLALLAVVLPIWAQPAAAATRLEVSAGYAGFHVPGRALPVQVTVTADRLVSGELAVTAPGRKEPVTTLPIEVAGGSVKRFLLVVPGGVLGDSGSLDVSLRQGGRTLGQGRAEARSANDAELVGLGSALLVGHPVPGPAALAVDVGVARFAALEPGFLTQAPAALEGLSTVGLAAGELAALAPSARAGLLRWVADGGHLLLDDTAPAPADGLPAEWHPGDSGRAVAGRGDVRFTGGAMAAGRWAGLVEPADHGGADGMWFGSSETVANSLAEDAGLRLPALVWLLGFLGTYVVVVGPLTALVLRRRRRPELAWVVVPVLAIVFTVFAYSAGNQLRPGSGLAHATLLETGGPAPVATSWVGLSRRGAGTAVVDLPASWTVEPTGANDGSWEAVSSGVGPSGRLVSTGAGRDGTAARLPLTSGEFGLFKASGPVSLPGRLEVTASSPSDGEARGTVRNGLPFAVDGVAVFVGSSRARVGALEPGQQQEWSVGPGDRTFDPSGFDTWQSFPPGGAPGLNSDGVADTVNLALWQSAQQDLGLESQSPGTAVAVGWTRQWRPTFTVDGRTRRAPGRTAVLGRAPVTAVDGRATDLASRREIVRGAFPGPRGWNGQVGEATVVKFTLPAGTAESGKRLVLHSSVPTTDLAVWQDGAWRPLPVVFNGVVVDPNLQRKLGLFAPPTTMPIPAPSSEPSLVGPGQASSPTTVTVGPPVAPPQAQFMSPPPMRAPGFPVQAGSADVPIPAGAAAGGIVYLRLQIDPSSFSPDAIFSLGELR